MLYALLIAKNGGHLRQQQHVLAKPGPQPWHEYKAVQSKWWQYSLLHLPSLA